MSDVTYYEVFGKLFLNIRPLMSSGQCSSLFITNDDQKFIVDRDRYTPYILGPFEDPQLDKMDIKCLTGDRIQKLSVNFQNGGVDVTFQDLLMFTFFLIIFAGFLYKKAGAIKIWLLGEFREFMRSFKAQAQEPPAIDVEAQIQAITDETSFEPNAPSIEPNHDVFQPDENIVDYFMRTQDLTFLHESQI